jgi:hypothetical protein
MRAQGSQFYAERASDKFLALNAGRSLTGAAVFGAFNLRLCLLVQKVPKIAVVNPNKVQLSNTHLIQCISPPNRHSDKPSSNDYRQNYVLWEWCKSFRFNRKNSDMRAISGKLCKSNFLRLCRSLDATLVNDVYKRG